MNFLMKTMVAVLALLILIFLAHPQNALAAVQIKVTADDAPLFAKPDAGSAVVGHCTAGEVLSVEQSTKYFYKVTNSEGAGGYLRKKDAVVIEDSSSEDEEKDVKTDAASPLYVMPAYVTTEQFTKEWQVRTLRWLGAVELITGLVALSGGLVIMAGGFDSSGDSTAAPLLIVGGALVTGIGGVVTYWGYSDLRRAYQVDREAFWGYKSSRLFRKDRDGKAVAAWFPVFAFQFQ